MQAMFTLGFRLSVFFVTCLMGCSGAYHIDVLNNSGKGFDAVWEGKSYSVAKDGVLKVRVRDKSANTFTFRIDDMDYEYSRTFGPPGCWEFPSDGFCNTWELRPDYSIWYLGGPGPLIPPPSMQPEGFPIRPSSIHRREAQVGKRVSHEWHFPNP